MKKVINIIIIFFFVAILATPIIAELIPVFPEIVNTENRAMKSLSDLNAISLDSFPREFDDYYSDNFKARNYLLKLNSKIRYQLFNIPPYSGKAFLGRQGWMYSIKDEMDLYLGNNLFNEDTLMRFIEIINYRKHLLDSINCKYYLVIIPIKASVYPEYIPFSKRKTGQTTLTDQVVKSLNMSSDVQVIDLRDDLIAHKHDHRVFHKTDNHWNEYGGYIAYKAIMEVIAKEIPALKPIDISNFKVELVKTKGKNLTRMMGIIDGEQEIEILCRSKFTKTAQEGKKANYPIPAYFPHKSRYEQVFVTNNIEKPRLLANLDSFGLTLVPFLSEHFSKSVFIFDGWKHNLNEEILFKEKPDVYIHLITESFLSNIPRKKINPNR